MCEVLAHDVEIRHMVVARYGFHSVKGDGFCRRAFRDGLRDLAVATRFRKDIGFLLCRVDEARNRVDRDFRIGTATAISGDDIPSVLFFQIMEGEAIREDEGRFGLPEIRIVFFQFVKFSEISIAVLLDAFAICRGEFHHFLSDRRYHAFCKRGRKPYMLVKIMVMVVVMMFMLVIMIVMIVVVVLRFLMFMFMIVVMFFIMIRFFMLMLMLMLRFFMFVLVVVVIGIFVFMIVIVIMVFLLVMVMFFRREKRVFYDVRHHKFVHAVEFRKIFIDAADCEEKRCRACLDDVVGTRFIRVQIAVIDEIFRLDGRTLRKRTRPVVEGIDRCDDFHTVRLFFGLFISRCLGCIPRACRKTYEGREHHYTFFPIFHIKKPPFFLLGTQIKTPKKKEVHKSMRTQASANALRGARLSISRNEKTARTKRNTKKNACAMIILTAQIMQSRSVQT